MTEDRLLVQATQEPHGSLEPKARSLLFEPFAFRTIPNDQASDPWEFAPEDCHGVEQQIDSLVVDQPPYEDHIGLGSCPCALYSRDVDPVADDSHALVLPLGDAHAAGGEA